MRTGLAVFALASSLAVGVPATCPRLCGSAGAADAPPAPPPSAPGAVPPDPAKPAPPVAPNLPPPVQKGAPPPAKPPEPPRMTFPSADRVVKPDGSHLYFYRTNFVRPQDLIKAVKTLLDVPGVTMSAVDRPPPLPPPAPQVFGSEVILQGTEESIQTALDVFAYFDVPDPQVFVEAKIIEVTYDNNFEFGFSSVLDRDKGGPNTFFRGEAVTLNPPSFFQSQLPGALPFQGAGVAFGFVGEALKKYGDFDLSLQALQHNGTAEILSRPSIVATEGVEATVSTTQKTPIIAITDSNSITPPTSVPAGVPVTPIGLYGTTVRLQSSYVETKIGLNVTPILIGDGFVKMKVLPTVSTVTGFSVGPGGTTAPIISDRNANTTITMADGDTLVIGGLYTDTTLKDTAKIPFLGDLPCLGFLFSRVRDTKVKTELMFHITPHILRKRSDYKVIAPPCERERLEGTCAAPLPLPPPLPR